MKFIEDNESDIDNQGINIVPMIDVIFAILTFFIISSLDLIRIDKIPVNLPKASTSNKVEKKPLILTIDNKNNIYIDSKPINSADLIDQINQLISDNSKNILVISADKDVSYGKFVEILDQIRSLENLRIGIATEK